MDPVTIDFHVWESTCGDHEAEFRTDLNDSWAEVLVIRRWSMPSNLTPRISVEEGYH